ncbi:TPA: hypothetical protein N0F65_009773 [Lagenidium giganteum]|uniref:Anaphase-promoting complex subunit 5 n=1 Tax=Lagenidium giganteum TaxID=4803 RepID=A0AAV2YRE1_9STRA|nr:TPA: hypothetical protein N0F65_009773 [Lagenidium giganteum]
MAQVAVNGYSLALCLLVVELVERTQDESAQDEEMSFNESGVWERVPPDCQRRRSPVSKRALNGLARFLCDELQHPLTTETPLAKLLQRLTAAVKTDTDGDDARVLATALLTHLRRVTSPDAAHDALGRIAACVAPLSKSQDRDGDNDGVDSTSVQLVRRSVLGVWVRKFLLQGHRALFDGLARLYESATAYVAAFDELPAREAPASRRRMSSLEWRTGGTEDDTLPLSPIVGAAATAMATGEDPNTSMRDLSLIDEGQDSSQDRDEAALASAACDLHMWTRDQESMVTADLIQHIGRAQLDQHSRDAHVRSALVKEADSSATSRSKGGQSSSRHPSAIFLRYLDALSRQDYQCALDSLHQYHDITLCSRQRDRGGAPAAGAAGAAGATSDAAQAANPTVAHLHFQGTGVQYAALNLAGLHAVFGHHQIAYECIQEAIRVAQHHGDHVCVAFALSWLVKISYRLGRSKTEVLALMDSCVERAKELKLASLQVLMTFTHVEESLLHGRPLHHPNGAHESTTDVSSAFHTMLAYAASPTPVPRPQEAWEALHAAVHMVGTITTPLTTATGGGHGVGPGGRQLPPGMQNAQQAASTGNAHSAQTALGGAGAGTAAGGVPWTNSVQSVLDTMWKLNGKSCLAISGAWRVLGNQTLAETFSDLYETCYGDVASASEVAAALCQRALSATPKVLSTGNFSGDDNVHARGLVFLLDSNDRCGGGLLAHVPCQRACHEMFFRWALGAGEYMRATAHVEALLALSPRDKDLPTYVCAQLTQLRLWGRMGFVNKCLDAAGQLNALCSEHEMLYWQAEVLLLICTVQLQASIPHAPFDCLKTLLQCIDLSTRHHYDSILARAHLVMTELYLHMGKASAAMELLNTQMPFVIECEDVETQAHSYLLLAKAALAREEDDVAPVDPSDGSVLNFLHQSHNLYLACRNAQQLQEVSYLRAMVHHRDGNAEAKEASAAQFEVWQAHLQRAQFRSVEATFDSRSPAQMRSIITSRSQAWPNSASLPDVDLDGVGLH